MRFELDGDHYDFLDVVESALGQHGGPRVLRAIWDGDVTAEARLAESLVSIGVTGLTVPAAHGGSGLDVRDTVLVLEALGRHGVARPHASAVGVVAPILAKHGEEAAVAPLLASIADGTALATVQQGWDGWAPWASEADIVMVVDDDRVDVIVRSDAAPATIETFADAVDPGRRVGRLAKDAGAAIVLGADAARDAFDRAAVATALELAGVARAMIDMAVTYAIDRHQFGRSVGSFQAVKHLLADAYTAVETARRSAWWAALCLDESNGDVDEAVSVAKFSIGEAASVASHASLQVHGGIGYTWECDLHLWMKRAQALSGAWGSTAEHGARLERLYLDDVPTPAGR